MNVRLPSGSDEKRRAQNSATWIALLFMFACVGALVWVTSLVMPQVTGLVIVVAGIFLFVAIHYFTWGRWLIAYAERAKQQASEDER